MLTREAIIERLDRLDRLAAADADVSARLRTNHDAAPAENAVRGAASPENPWYPENGVLRPAAVLVPLVNHVDGVTVMLTRRTEHLNNHAGQISFPGGRLDDCDESHEAAALRETEEEVGIVPARIDVVGYLDDYVVGTGFLVRPIVGFIEPPVEVAPHDHEVAEVFEAPLEYLIDPANIRRGHREYYGRVRHFHAITYGNYYIWGATAGMLRNLSERLVD